MFVLGIIPYQNMRQAVETAERKLAKKKLDRQLVNRTQEPHHFNNEGIE